MADSRPTYGGQALIEGVLIRGARTASIALRRPDGTIITKTENIEQGIAATLRSVPLLRGAATLYETFAVGTKALYYSARVAEGKDEEGISAREMLAATLAIAAAASIFIAGPLLLSKGAFALGTGALGASLGEGMLRLGLIGGYIGLISRMKEVQRVFAYHGAEHRAIHAHEHGEPLNVDSVKQFDNAHPRCGTAFLLTVGVISFAAFAFLGHGPIEEQIAARVLLLPLIAGMAYEVLRATQVHEDHWLASLVRKPNLWLQRLTTRDPDDGQIEVALAALHAAIAAETEAAAAAEELALSPIGADID